MRECVVDLASACLLLVLAVVMLAACSCLETIIFQTVFGFLRFDVRLVFGFFMAVQSVEMVCTGGKGWF